MTTTRPTPGTTLLTTLMGSMAVLTLWTGEAAAQGAGVCPNGVIINATCTNSTAITATGGSATYNITSTATITNTAASSITRPQRRIRMVLPPST